MARASRSHRRRSSPNMIYKPNFCCNCGEVIDRAEPKWTDSSRFCDVCKHDFLPQRAAPLIFATIMLFVGLAGAAGLMRGDDRNVLVKSKSPANTASNVASPVKTASPALNAVRPSGNQGPRSSQRSPEIATDDYSVCGAMTKKGTPCSRRVKGGGRCWQHRGETVQNEESK